MDYGTRSGKSLSLGMPMAPQDNLRTPKSQSLGMPRKASPLSSSSIGNFTWSYIFIHHMICVFLGASCMILVFTFSLPQSSLLYTPFERDTHELEFIRILYVLHLYLLSYIVFALVLHLYLLEHGGNFCFIENIILSCFTQIILRVLTNMVICLNNPNMLGIQDQ